MIGYKNGVEVKGNLILVPKDGRLQMVFVATGGGQTPLASMTRKEAVQLQNNLEVAAIALRLMDRELKRRTVHAYVTNIPGQGWTARKPGARFQGILVSLHTMFTPWTRDKSATLRLIDNPGSPASNVAAARAVCELLGWHPAGRKAACCSPASRARDRAPRGRDSGEGRT